MKQDEEEEQARLAEYARREGANDDGRLAHEDIHWTETDFPVSRLSELMTPDGWAAWLRDEIAMLEEDGYDPGRWSCLFEEEIEEPVIILDHEGIVIWDGWHRCAASVSRGHATLKAVVGRKKEPSPSRPGP